MTARDLNHSKERGEPLVMLTCYDHPTALREDAAGVDVVLVGDSVGTNVLGYPSVEQVSMEDMLHHLRAVRRGVSKAFLLADMPHGSYATPALAVENARRFRDAGADGVKLEGGRSVLDVVRALRADGHEVCGHLGFTPQTAGPRGHVVGKTVDEATALLADARALAEAGVFLLVLELVPEEVSRAITANLRCPVIGIGSGRGLDGEVQVVNDILGMGERVFRHSHRFTAWGQIADRAIRAYVAAVRKGRFPGDANSTHLPPNVLEALGDLVAVHSRRSG